MKKALVVLALVSQSFLGGCEEVDKLFGDQNRKMEKLKRENLQLKGQVDKLTKQLEESESNAVVNKVLVALYDLRHGLEKYALDNKGKYPYATNINELQAVIKTYLPESFEIEAVYLEKIRSQERGYIMIASVKGREIVVSNLL